MGPNKMFYVLAIIIAIAGLILLVGLVGRGPRRQVAKSSADPATNSGPGKN